MNRRETRLRACAALALAVPAIPALAAPPLVEVWKDPNCGCCQDWVEHLQAQGFKVKVHDVGNAAARQRLGVPAALGSCHTARMGPYVLEGHVPAADVLRLWRERPKALGLVVPGMPIGSPGMDGPEYKGRRDAYAVLLLLADGQTQVFQRYPGRPTQAQASARARTVSQEPPIPWTEAQVRRIDREAGKLTLRHETIVNLDMPPMTMVFTMADPAQLDGLQPGQRVRVQVVHDKGVYRVLRLEALGL